jgi:hypothetical protein
VLVVPGDVSKEVEAHRQILSAEVDLERNSYGTIQLEPGLTLQPFVNRGAELDCLLENLFNAYESVSRPSMESKDSIEFALFEIIAAAAGEQCAPFLDHYVW